MPLPSPAKRYAFAGDCTAKKDWRCCYTRRCTPPPGTSSTRSGSRSSPRISLACAGVRVFGGMAEAVLPLVILGVAWLEWAALARLWRWVS